MARCILQVAFVLIAACFPLGGILAAPTGAGELELIILHNNDMHARFEQTSVSSSKCTPEDAASNKCYGGFARTAHEIRKFREEANKTGGTPVLYLNAGDTYTGTPWFTIFRDNITAAFLNVLKPDAISLGNHEFDEGVEGLVPFLEKAEFPVLAANLDLRQTPELATQKTLKNSTVFTINGVRIGVIGYLTPETKNLTIPNKVTFLPEIASINKEADQLTKDGIHIIIALGHSGYEADQEIAKNCPHVDIVIGGHTNTFLYNGKPPSIETPAGPYPKVIAQKSGKKVPVVQAYAYTKYLGKLHVKFDKNGHLIEWNGEPILLNGTVPQDSDVLQLLEVYRPAIAEIESSIVGQTKVQLQGGAEHCRRGECNLGNLIADSMVHARFMEHKENIQGAWTDAAIAFIQGGGIRTSIDKKKDGSITRNDILSVLPFRNKLYVAETTGDLLKKALERSASKLDDGNSNGGFLQMSGIHTVFDHDNPVGKRVISVKALCAACEVPRYYDVEADKKYKIILPEFLLIGGDGFNWTSSSDPLANSILMKAGDGQALIDYLQAKGPVYPAVEWRLTIKNLKEPPSKGGSGRNSVSLVLLAGALLLRNLY